MLVLSCDNFTNILVATVEKRPDRGEEKQISISFYGDNQENQMDLMYLFENSFSMIESPTYFESVKNVLSSLQRINSDDLPFQSYLLKCSGQEIIPKYFQDHPVINLQTTFDNTERINIRTSEFPERLGTLDPSQIEAFEHCLKSELSLVQGPPGTGKSYIGVKLFEVIHRHLKENSAKNAPILVLCYTNHALDQFLDHIITNVTKKVIRVGSRSRDERMKDYNIRNFIRAEKRQFEYYRQRDDVVAILKEYLDTFSNELSYEDFLKFAGNDYNKGQDDDDGDDDDDDDDNGGDIKCSNMNFNRWGQWIKSIKKKIKEDLTLLKVPKSLKPSINEIENEDDEDDEDLVETLLNERRFDYGNISGGSGITAHDISEYDIQSIVTMTRLEKRDYKDIQDIFDIKENDRIYYYRYLLNKKIRHSLKTIQDYAKQYKELSDTILDYENKAYIRALSSVNVVAATITGASRLKRVFDSINSKCVIIEEAAEVLEGHIVSVLPKTIEHLVLIGDHEQLKPSCAVYQLAEKFQLNVSLFERIMKNGGAHRQLSIQRRMVPNISQFIHPIYPNLRNHPEVLIRFATESTIKGIQKNIFFLEHTIPESSPTESTSKSNLFEADYVVGLADYLLKQEYKPTDIVILTPYTGQLLKIKNQIRNRKHELLSKVQVRTVDQYQGEECNIVILSLVRSNERGDSGFVKIKNRINVAISRARNAMYLVGNSDLLRKANPIWENMFKILSEPSVNAIGPILKLRCENHKDQITNITSGKDFANVPQGGCLLNCSTRLECGHQCGLACHIFDQDHINIKCTKPCEHIHQKCGHTCKKTCSDDCGLCEVLVDRDLPCGHKKKLACNIDPLQYKCQEPCQKQRRCGHKCELKCSEYCEKNNCKEKVEKKLQCGHIETKECYNNSNVCNAKCKDILPCGDPCSQKCKDHKTAQFGIRSHPPCSKKECTRELFCGHRCNSQHACSSGSCGDCEKKCLNACTHSVCNTGCSKLCNPCREKCKRGCIHVGKCKNLCKEQCSIKNCDQRCTKKLPCKHQCIGLCGEKCVSICRICNPDYLEPITRMKLSEFDENDCFIELHKGHVFLVDNLDTFMNIKDESGKIVHKKCPSCNMIISAKDAPRYKDIINKTWNQIDSIKRKLMERVTKEETDMVVKAMGGAAGHWFVCENKHTYYIGECGGAMQIGNCIECKAKVGGTNHSLLPNNKHSDIDGSNNPLYRPFIQPDRKSVV